MTKEYSMICKDADESTNTWTEKISVPEGADPVEHCKSIVKEFNDTLRPLEKPREFVSLVGATGTEFCSFSKANTVTIMEHGSSFDVMECSKCGIYLKRLGLGQEFNYDYRECKPDLVCRECNKQFKTKSSLKRHNTVGHHKTEHWTKRTR